MTLFSTSQKSPITCAVIIVTHNSQPYLPLCLQALKQQTRPPDQIIVIDSGSQKTDYLRVSMEDLSLQVDVVGENIGFCQGNNRGLSFVDPSTTYVLFLNPDAFLTPIFLEQAIHEMELPVRERVAALTGRLLGFDIHQQRPTGWIDSTGIFQTWYGRWYDRGQGEPLVPGRYDRMEHVPALCGALMFCRLSALKSVEFASHVVMDPDFHMYKEDIDLSLRLRQKGWSLLFLPHLSAYHCRGWNKERSRVPRSLRLLSARNEMRLHARFKSPYYLYSVLKYFAVQALNY
jgi:N-acetylglucosaminyl-diphospho-decaprenol L-rhamnosyltransferase